MEQIIEQITSNPVSLIIGLALLIFIIFSMIKKAFKLIIVSVLALVLYIAYLNYTGEKPPDFIEEIMDEVDVDELKKSAEKAEKEISKSLKKAKKDINKKIKEVEKTLEKNWNNLVLKRHAESEI